MTKSPATPVRTSPRRCKSTYASTPDRACKESRGLIRKGLVKKVSKSAVEKSSHADDTKLVGKEKSKRNENSGVLVVGKIHKRKGTADDVTEETPSGKNMKKKRPPGKPKADDVQLVEDDVSDEVPEEDEDEEDDDDYDEEEEDKEEEVLETLVEESWYSSSAEDEEPDAVRDHEHGQLADRILGGGKRKRGDWERLRATDHTVVAPRQPKNHPTGNAISGRASSISTSHTVGTTDAAAMSALHLDGLISVRGMSRTESMRNRQKHVADRVRIYVKDYVFRRIKFINSDLMFQKAIKLVMDHEGVPLHQRGKFQMLYESVFNEALNTKRSSCEQAGGKIVRESIASFREKCVEQFFTIDELCKLRRARTERERRAFFWFFGTFLECVCGKKGWGKQKQLALVSEATDKETHVKLVTKSDEAFALLLFDNYIEKWKTPKGASEGENKQTRQRGKYTGKKSGHCKYGGWSREGTARFNELYNLVQEDRSCQQAKPMEKELLAFCRKEMDSGAAQDEGAGGGAAAMVMEQDAVPLEAAWDLDDDDPQVLQL
jgi:hypothetical protein